MCARASAKTLAAAIIVFNECGDFKKKRDEELKAAPLVEVDAFKRFEKRARYPQSVGCHESAFPTSLLRDGTILIS